MNPWMFTLLMMIAAIISLTIWSRFLYIGIRHKNLQETMISITAFYSLFIWFAWVLIQNWASFSNYTLYTVSLNLGYVVLIFAHVALWRVVLFYSGDLLRFILKIRKYRVLFIITLVLYAIFYLLASGMFLFPPAEQQPNAFFNLYTSYGLLSVWPSISFGWPLLHLAGTITLDALLILTTITSFMATSITFFVYNWRSNSVKSMRMVGSTAGSSAAITFTSFACCSLPLQYPLLTLLIGSTAAQSLSYRIIHEPGPLFSLFQIAILSLVTVTTVFAANRLRHCNQLNTDAIPFTHT
jgi:hypothetical protein